MSVIELLLYALAGNSLLFVVAWCIQRRTRDAGVVDVTWALAFAPCAIFYAVALDASGFVPWLVVVLVAAWSLRLAGHLLATRVLTRRPEDGRYAALRTAKGERADRWFFWFFQAQAASVVVLSQSQLGVLLAPPTEPIVIALGVACFLVSIAGEAIADRQLESFRSDPANRGLVCTTGLWSASRHPNYFFEWMHWLAYPILAFGSPYAWMTWIAPPVLLFLLLFLTGIPPTEEQALRSRGDAYRSYQRSTSAFIPWFRRRVRAVNPTTEARNWR